MNVEEGSSSYEDRSKNLVFGEFRVFYYGGILSLAGIMPYLT